MKSLINWLAVIALLLIFGSNSNAQTVSLTGTVNGPIGSEHTIQLVTTDLTNLNYGSLDIKIQYDASKVFIYSATPGSVISNSGASFAWNNLSAGKIFGISSATGSSFTGSGVIATLRVKIVGSSGFNNNGISFASATYSIRNGSTNNFTQGSALPVTVSGGVPITVEIPKISQLANTNDVIVPVTITDIAKYGIFSWTVQLSYDPTYFEIVDAIDIGGDYSSALTKNILPGSATIIGTFNDGSLISRGLITGGSTTLVNLKMNFKGTNVVDTPLTFVLAGSNLDGGLPGANFISTTVTVSNNNPVPALTSVSPNSALAGAPATAIVVTGTNFVENSVVRVNGTNIATTYVSSSTLNATIPVTNLATAATLNITVFNPTPAGGTSGSLPFTVGNPPPAPASMNPGAFFWGTNNVSVSGTNILAGATVNAGSGVNFSSYNYGSAPSTVSFIATVAPGTVLGTRSITIQNSGSTSVEIPGSVDIRYRAPSFTSITPSSAVQGTSLNVVITGSDFFDQPQVKTALNLGAGITINSVTINSQNQITAAITVAADAAVGPRDLTLTNTVSGANGGIDNEVGAFSVILSGNPIPTITTITPNSGRQGESVTAQIIGTNFATAYTTVSLGSNISVTAIAIPNSTTINLTLSIGNSATLGARDVTITNAGPGGGVAALANGFTVNPPANTPPVANNDQYQTPFNTALVVNSPGILQNDTDDGGIGNLSAQLVTGLTPANAGTLNLSLNGGFTFTPAQGFSGNATFTYRALDAASAQSNTATVTLVVGSPANSNPLANDDNYNTAFNTALVVPAPGILGNDIDDGGVAGLQAQIVNTAPNNVGTITVGSNGSINYTPANGYSGTFEFTYRAIDGQGALSNLATVRITVAGQANAAPVANNDTYAVAAGATLAVTAPGILSNDTDDGGVAALTAELVQTQNMTGSFTLNANGSFNYTPIPTFFGTSSFTYRARDAQGLASNIATVTITVGLAAPTHNASWPSGQNPSVSTSPSLTFNPVSGAQFYEVQVSKAANFGPNTQFDACYPDCGGIAKVSSTEANTITFTTFTPSVVANGLKGATQYYWRARALAQNGIVVGDWSTSRSFVTVAAPNSPILALPNNNDTGVPAAAVLSWLASTGATSYNVQVSVNPNFDVKIVDINTGNTTYTTPALSGGPVFFWRVKASGIGGSSEWSDVRRFTRAALVSIGDDDTSLPTEYALEQNYPNPFNPSTSISFSLPQMANVTLEVYNLHGQLVGSILQNVTKNPGKHTVSFDASNLSSGIYIYRITAGNFMASQKMVLVK